MSRPAVQKQKLQQPPAEVTEPKKVKRSEILRAKEEYNGHEMFFEVKDLDQAKEWLWQEWDAIDDDDVNKEPVDFYIEQCVIGTEDRAIVYRLDQEEVLLHKNRTTLEKLQVKAPALTDEAVTQLLKYLANEEATLVIDC
jgi:hypothetical protein